MNKKNLTLALGGAIASGLLSAAPAIQAGENPFAMSSITPVQLAAADDKAKEGKCGEGKCGADKAKAASGEKAAEGKCGADKAKEGSCGANKTDGAKDAPAGQ
ncbi:hypothetical protein NP590_14765 [Methylomonas sp. SURF-2]|uniref:Low-complexity protein n=1 Tax=Methylomonas subterranea TaxID=2952225 RepID=A0ABT1TIV6_9GAMM|nr:hypothetical protein [Methylomonas sp. SURF-2]MCQ8105375.1 hypothetical protein [Methylomonas sp. SURF-2]